MCIQYIKPIWVQAQLKLKLRYNRRSVGHSALVSCTHTVPMIRLLLQSGRYGFVDVGCPHWRVQSLLVHASTVILGSESRGTHDYKLISQIRDSPKPGVPGLHINIPQEQGGPVIPPGTVFPFRGLLRLVGLRWRYSNPPPQVLSLKLYCERRSVGQFFLVSGPHPGPATRCLLLSDICSLGPSLTRGLVCNLLVKFKVTLGSNSCRTHGHILMPRLRLPQPGGPGPRIYIPQEQGDPDHCVHVLSPLRLPELQ
jgi:hypothetical protein